MTSATSSSASSPYEGGVSPSTQHEPLPLPTPPSTFSPASPLSPSSLLSALVAQLEFYFSPANLQTDAFLLSQMDAQRFVPVATITSFRKVRALTTDLATVLTAMSQCANMQLDPSLTLVRPTQLSAPRSTLLMRDIPASTPLEDVQALFALSGCPAAPLSLRSEGDDTWSVVLASEDECTEVALWLSNQALRGRLVKCRVKAEPSLRSSGGYSASTSPVVLPVHVEQTQQYAQQFRGGPAPPVYGYPNNPYAAPNGSVYQHMPMPSDVHGAYGPTGYNPYSHDGRHYRGYSGNGGIDLHIPLPDPHRHAALAGKKKTKPPSSAAVPAAPGATAVEGGSALPSAPGTGKSAKKKQRKRAAAAAALAASTTSVTVPVLASDSSTAAAATPVDALPSADPIPADAVPAVSSVVPSPSVVASSTHASIPLIAPSSYPGATEARLPSAGAPAVQTPLSSPSSFPPISASSATASQIAVVSAPPSPATSTAVSSSSSSPKAALLNYAGHVGSLSSAEVARVAAAAAAAKALRDAKARTEKGEPADDAAVPREETKEDEAALASPVNGERNKENTPEHSNVLARPHAPISYPSPSRDGVWVKREAGASASPSTSPSWRERHREYRKVIHAPHPQRYGGYQGRRYQGVASPSPASSTSASSAHSASSSPSSPSSSSSAVSASTADSSSSVKRPVTYADLIKRTASASPQPAKAAAITSTTTPATSTTTSPHPPTSPEKAVLFRLNPGTSSAAAAPGAAAESSAST